MKAVIIKEVGRPALADIKEQAMRPGYVKVKTVAVAINPTDFHHAAGAGPVGHILGCDLAGIVEEVGSECTVDVKKGDRVFALAHGANTNNAEDGAYAEYALVRDGHLAKIPEGMSFEDAATLGVGITTVGQTLYMTFKLPLPAKPAEKPFPILIYGGSTATGTLAIQYAKLSGLTVLTTCSPSNFDLVKSRGADAVFDYHDPTCAEQIRKYTNNSLHYILDTVSTTDSFPICADAFPPKDDSSTSESEKLNYVGLLPVDAFPRKDEPNVSAQAVLAYTSFGEPFTKFGMDFPFIKEHFEFGKMFWKLTEELVAQGKVKPHPAVVKEGGLGGVPEGIVDVATGKVSGAKLVYKVADTPAVEDSKTLDEDTVIKAPELKNW